MAPQDGGPHPSHQVLDLPCWSAPLLPVLLLFPPFIPELLL